MNKGFKLSFGEEVANSISHGVMAILILFGLPITVLFETTRHGILGGLGVGYYMICMFLMFIVSCLYHTMNYGTTYKYIFRKLDHIMILLAIAGSYTPICLVLVDKPVGYIILAIEWILAVIGIIAKSIWNKSHMGISLTLYISMGWLAVFILPTLLKANKIFLGLILLGGLMYTIGVFFYKRPSHKYNHFIWHLCINAAAVAHFIAIVFFM